MWRFPPSYRIIMAKENNKRNPLSGIIAGIALLVIGTCILWLNEGDYVANMKAVKDVSENVTDISSETVDASNNGKLVCLSGGFVIPDELVEDSLFSVGTKTAKLERIVEVYQWRESQDSDNNYTYDKEWSEDLIDSSDFHNTGHSNPGVKEVENESFCVSRAEIGAFKLSEDQLKNLETNETLSIDPATAVPQYYSVQDNYITDAQNINSPSVGDLRIHYEYNTFSAATVLAVQQNDSFTDFVSENGIKINRVDEGLLKGDQVVQKITEENNALKWALRLIGALAIIIGYCCIVGPISNLAAFVPILGSIVGFALYLVASLVGLIHSFIVIAVAWFVFRPVLSVVLLAAAALICVGIWLLLKKKKAQQNEDAVGT